MLKQKVLSGLVALSLGASGAAFAQGSPWPQSNDAPPRSQINGGDTRTYHGDPRAQQRNDNRGNDYRGNAYRGNDYRGSDYRGSDYRGSDYRGSDYRGNGYHGDGRGRGAGPDHAWYRGSRLPPEYNNRHYVVDDWRGHHLSAPPRGYHWVQAGNDYVLAAIATGVIASILLNQ